MLADRLNALPAEARVAVANAGISGNTVSVQPTPYDPTNQCCGPPTPERLDRDVLSVSGVWTLCGPNDPTVMIADLRNDCYHPNAAGDQLLGRHISLSAVLG